MAVSNFSKHVFFLVNLFALAVGAALIAVGVLFFTNTESMSYFQIAQRRLGSDFLPSRAAQMFIGIGVIMIVFANIGFYGAKKQSNWTLNVYGALIIVASVLQIIAGILAAAATTRFELDLKSAMTRQVANDYDGISQLSRSWDYLQVNKECCGSESPNDWDLSQWMKPDHYQTPRSCCVLRVKDYTNIHDDSNVANPEGCRNKQPGAIHTNGCHPFLRDWLYRACSLIMALAFSFLLIQAGVVGMACWLRRTIEHNESESVQEATETQLKPVGRGLNRSLNA